MSRRPASDPVAETRSLPLHRLKGTAIDVFPGTDEARTIYIGALTVNEILGLSRAVGKALGPVPFAAAQAAMNADKSGSSDAQSGIAALLSLLEPEAVNSILGIVTGQPPEWCGETITLDTLSEIIEAVVAHNDPARLVAAFRQAARGWSPSKSVNSSALSA